MRRQKLYLLSIYLILFHTSYIGCLDGFECFEEYGSCYHFSDTRLLRHEASCWCRQHGAWLVKFDTEQEQQFIYAKANASVNRAYNYWIGATDLKEEGRFVWEDGADAMYVQWFRGTKPGEPDNAGDNEHCGLIARVYWDTSSKTEKFLSTYFAFDAPCNVGLIHFVCEKDMKGPTPGRRLTAVTSSRDIIYSDHVIAIYPGTSLLKCTDYCYRDCGRCWAIGYNHDIPACILYDNYYSRLQGNTVIESGYLIYD